MDVTNNPRGGGKKGSFFEELFIFVQGPTKKNLETTHAHTQSSKSYDIDYLRKKDIQIISNFSKQVILLKRIKSPKMTL